MGTMAEIKVLGIENICRTCALITTEAPGVRIN